MARDVDSVVVAMPGRPHELMVALLREHPAWLVVEVQLRRDARKRRRWALATALLLDRTGKPGDLVVITPSARVAAWARDVAVVEGPLGTRMGVAPVVILLGRAEAEALLATGRPELAFFAAWAMRRRKGRKARDVVTRALECVAGAGDRPLRARLTRSILSVISDELAGQVREVVMRIRAVDDIPMPKWFNDLEREIEARGEARGVAKGEARGKAAALLAVLSARGLRLDAAARARVDDCADGALLDRWITRAVSAATVEEVFRADG